MGASSPSEVTDTRVTIDDMLHASLTVLVKGDISAADIVEYVCENAGLSGLNETTKWKLLRTKSEVSGVFNRKIQVYPALQIIQTVGEG